MFSRKAVNSFAFSIMNFLRHIGPCPTYPVLGLVQGGSVAQAITPAGRVIRRGHSSRPGNRSGGTLKGFGGRDTRHQAPERQPSCKKEGFFIGRLGFQQIDDIHTQDLS